MLWFFVLWFLFVLHCSLAGFCDAEGRNGLIDKNVYFLQGCLRGIYVGHFCLLPSFLWICFLYLFHPVVWNAYAVLAKQMSIFFFFYTSLVVLAFIGYAFLYAESRILMSVLLFGPLTLLLPLVILCGGLWTAYFSPIDTWPWLTSVILVAFFLRALLNFLGWGKKQAEMAMELHREEL